MSRFRLLSIKTKCLLKCHVFGKGHSLRTTGRGMCIIRVAIGTFQPSLLSPLPYLIYKALSMFPFNSFWNTPQSFTCVKNPSARCSSSRKPSTPFPRAALRSGRPPPIPVDPLAVVMFRAPPWRLCFWRLRSRQEALRVSQQAFAGTV